MSGRDEYNFVKKKHSSKAKSSLKLISSKCSSFFIGFWWTCISTDSRHSYNCAPFHTDLSLYSYEAVFIQGLLKKNEKKLARAFNFTFCYIDRIYPIELEIKDTTYTVRSASYFDLCIEIDSDGRLKLKIYDKRNDFHFLIVNFPFI